MAKKSIAELSEETSDDILYEQAVEYVKAAKRASASLLQRKFRIGYARAARLLDLLEENEIIGPADGANSRKILDDSSKEA